MTGLLTRSLKSSKALWYGRSREGRAEIISCANLPFPSVTTGWSHRLAWPRTEPSQGSDTGSNPVGTTNTYKLLEQDGAQIGPIDSPNWRENWERIASRNVLLTSVKQ